MCIQAGIYIDCDTVNVANAITQCESVIFTAHRCSLSVCLTLTHGPPEFTLLLADCLRIHIKENKTTATTASKRFKCGVSAARFNLCSATHTRSMYYVEENRAIVSRAFDSRQRWNGKEMEETENGKNKRRIKRNKNAAMNRCTDATKEMAKCEQWEKREKWPEWASAGVYMSV